MEIRQIRWSVERCFAYPICSLIQFFSWPTLCLISGSFTLSAHLPVIFPLVVYSSFGFLLLVSHSFVLRNLMNSSYSASMGSYFFFPWLSLPFSPQWWYVPSSVSVVCRSFFLLGLTLSSQSVFAPLV